MVQRWTQQRGELLSYLSISSEGDILVQKSGIYELRGTITFIGQYSGALYIVDLALSNPPEGCSSRQSFNRVLASCHEGSSGHAPEWLHETSGARRRRHSPAVPAIVRQPELYECTFSLVARVDADECAAMLAVTYSMLPLRELHEGIMAHSETAATFLEVQRLRH